MRLLCPAVDVDVLFFFFEIFLQLDLKLISNEKSRVSVPVLTTLVPNLVTLGTYLFFNNLKPVSIKKKESRLCSQAKAF